jgi:hypothetical protein
LWTASDKIRFVQKKGKKKCGQHSHRTLYSFSNATMSSSSQNTGVVHAKRLAVPNLSAAFKGLREYLVVV